MYFQSMEWHRNHREPLARFSSLRSCLIESFVGFAHEPAGSRRSQHDFEQLPYRAIRGLSPTSPGMRVARLRARGKPRG